METGRRAGLHQNHLRRFNEYHTKEADVEKVQTYQPDTTTFVYHFILFSLKIYLILITDFDIFRGTSTHFLRPDQVWYTLYLSQLKIISCVTALGELHFTSVVDYSLYSHDLHGWNSINTFKRKFKLITIQFKVQPGITKRCDRILHIIRIAGDKLRAYPISPVVVVVVVAFYLTR